MQRIVTLLGIICFCFSVYDLNAQQYLSATYTDISVETDLTYGANYTVFDVPNTGSTTLRDLRMDLYLPNDNTDTDRPLVILFGTGSFFPQVLNGSIYGSRTDSVNVETAMRLAQLGYVVAVADYRNGWDPLSENTYIRIGSRVQALYRGQQDARAAVRFFRNSVVHDGNPYGICGDRITLWGVGTGGEVALAAGYLDAWEDLFLSKFFYWDPASQLPDPYVIEQFHSDVEGSTLTTHPFDGDTLNTPAFNNFDPQYNSEVQLVVNVAGAIGDSSWIDANDPPLIAFHASLDPRIPYTTGIGGVLPNSDFYLEVSGSYDAVRIANELGLNDALGEDTIDDVYTDAANEDNDGYAGLFPVTNNCFTNALGQDVCESDPYNWWDEAFWATVPYTDVNGSCFYPIQLEFCTFDYLTKLTHETSDATESRAIIDSIIHYFAPRAFNALDLGGDCQFSVDTDNLPAEVAQLSATPNPADETVVVSTGSDMPMCSITIFSVEGKVVSFRNNLSAQQFTLHRRDLPAGMYFVQVRFDGGTATQRVVFR